MLLILTLLLLLAETLHLDHNFDNYRYLNQSGCTSLDSKNDKEDFLVVEVGILDVGESKGIMKI